MGNLVGSNPTVRTSGESPQTRRVHNLVGAFCFVPAFLLCIFYDLTFHYLVASYILFASGQAPKLACSAVDPFPREACGLCGGPFCLSFALHPLRQDLFFPWKAPHAICVRGFSFGKAGEGKTGCNTWKNSGTCGTRGDVRLTESSLFAFKCKSAVFRPPAAIAHRFLQP